MRNENGVTLISLIIYIIVFTLVMSLVATITGVFSKSIRTSNSKSDSTTQYTTFAQFFSKDTNKQGINLIKCESNYVVFNDGINTFQYTYIPENKGIYRDKAKIAWDVDNCIFSTDIKNDKQQILVQFRSGDEIHTTTFTLN